MKKAWFIELNMGLGGELLTPHDMSVLIKTALPGSLVYVAISQYQPDNTQRRLFQVYSELEKEKIQELLHQHLPNRQGTLQLAPEILQPQE